MIFHFLVIIWNYNKWCMLINNLTRHSSHRNISYAMGVLVVCGINLFNLTETSMNIVLRSHTMPPIHILHSRKVAFPLFMSYGSEHWLCIHEMGLVRIIRGVYTQFMFHCIGSNVQTCKARYGMKRMDFNAKVISYGNINFRNTISLNFCC